MRPFVALDRRAESTTTVQGAEGSDSTAARADPATVPTEAPATTSTTRWWPMRTRAQPTSVATASASSTADRPARHGERRGECGEGVAGGEAVGRRGSRDRRGRCRRTWHCIAVLEPAGEDQRHDAGCAEPSGRLAWRGPSGQDLQQGDGDPDGSEVRGRRDDLGNASWRRCRVVWNGLVARHGRASLLLRLRHLIGSADEVPVSGLH